MKPDPEVERERIEALEAWRSERDQAAVDAALAEVARVAESDENIMPATIAAAKAGATTGEWAETLREVFGPYRGPTGVGGAAPGGERESLAATREKVDAGLRTDRTPDPHPGRQARSRRTLERLRADRPPGP